MTQLDLAMEPTPPESAVATLRAAGKPCACAGCVKPLTGRQRRFCSNTCRFHWWDQQHPRINRTPPEGPREGTILQAILALLADGQFRTAHEIAEAVAAFPHSVSARLSELRKRGHNIEADASNGNSRRAHRFRLVKA